MKKQYNTRAILASLLICGFVGMFSETALNIAMTNLMEVFHISAATAQWLTTGYLLTLGILMPFTGLLLQMYTTRQLFIVSTASLTAGTFLAAVSLNFEMLMFARVIQAIGMGLLLPLMFNTLLVIFPPEKRGAAMGYIGLVLSFAPALGPAISGMIIQYLSWHFIFWSLLPFIVIGMLFGMKYLENVTEVSKQRIDVLSAVLSTIGFGSIVFGFGQAGEGGHGGESSVALTLIIVGVIALILFVLRQNKDQPLLNLRVFKYPMFVVGVFLVMMCIVIFMTTMIVLPMFLQTGAGLSVFVTGLILLPGSAINGIFQMVSGRLYDKYGPKWVIIPGLVIVMLVLWFFTTLTPASSVGLIIALHMVLAGGIGLVWPASQTNALNSLPSELYPHGSAALNTLMQVVGAMGTAVAISILTGGKNKYLASSSTPTMPNEIANAITAGAQTVFWNLLLIAVIGFIIGLFVRRSVINRGTVESMNMH
ncbi:DHA2 family efflux MFS transporter permease subunit [Paenibacillus xylanilyticus]|uniref:Multidrug efflux MFS transporter n=1 Tax=Paenibacillus xylanilyticus TaxID=248903 RepID=A0A7Y6C1P1_9BACL|nr:DHA2 family efflux MFS transporter permease subunit [Paenibacillus xylanilyticus]NUU78973.1 multidrug efflux MFS transporter [Paenibacillus xylanilyticus]